MTERRCATAKLAGAAALAAMGLLPLQAQAQAATDRFIVSYKPGAAASATTAVAEVGGRVELELRRVDALAVSLPARAVAGLRMHPAIDSIEADPLRHAMRLPRTSRPSLTLASETSPYGIAMVQADQIAYDAGHPRTLCIVDSGYALGHEDLQTGNVRGSNLTRSGDWSTDENSHGTHVAGTIAAIGGNGVGVVGVVPTGQMPLYIAKVFDASGSARSSVIMKGVQACADAGANVISMSLGGGAPTRAEQRLYDSIAASDILVVAAAGNAGDGTVSYPAGYASVMSVAAVDATGAWAPFSQYNADVEIAGPGVGVVSTVPTGSQTVASLAVDGTSYLVQPMDGSPRLTASGPLADFGLGDVARHGSMAGKVCLILRGSITFADKVKNCQRSGGVGAVVYNNVAGELLGTLGDTATAIPSVGATQADGAAMLGQIGRLATVSVAGTADLYAAYSGTSMATPHVSAVAALVWSRRSACSAAQVRAALNASALDLGDPARDDKTGNGLVQAKAADDRLALNCGN